MILMVFIASVIVAVALRRQERRHRIAIVWELERLGVPVPPLAPKLKWTEAILNICLGMLLLFFGCASVYMHFRLKRELGELPGGTGSVPESEILAQAATYCAAGIAMVILGFRALMHIHRFERDAASAG